MRGHVGLWAGMICLGVAFLPVVIGLFWLPGDPYLPSRDRLAPPTFRHPMGTDWFGRDMLARVMLGGRSSVAIALLAVTLGGTVGLVLGGAAGYLGGLWEEAGMRLVDALLAFPAVLAALLLGAVWGPGLPGVATALALFNVPFFARIARAAAEPVTEGSSLVTFSPISRPRSSSRLRWGSAPRCSPRHPSATSGWASNPPFRPGAGCCARHRTTWPSPRGPLCSPASSSPWPCSA